MIKGLKVVMIVWAAIWILFGLAFIFAPVQLGDMFGFEQVPASTLYLLGSFGACCIPIGVFLIIAARDPIRHINWVRFAILGCLLNLAMTLYSLFQGFVTFEQGGMDIIMSAVFAAAFLALYPYHAPQQW